MLAQYGDDPAVVLRGYGLGRVLLWTTSLNLDWSTFPTTQDYVPLTQNLLLHIASQASAPVNLAQADTLVYSCCQDGSDSQRSNDWETCTIIDPVGQAHEVEGEFVGGEWVAEWQHTTTAGVYTVRMPGEEDKFYAVALQPDEADLAALDNDARKRFADGGHVSKYVGDVEELERAIQEETGEREWWRWFVFLALGVLCTELFLGWRFSS